MTKSKTATKKLDKFFKKVERYFSPKGKLAIGATTLALIAFLGVSSWMGTFSPPHSTVMITNLAQTTGGSGVIISSTPIQSSILTNAHICRVVKEGGWVNTIDQQRYLVEGYTMSPDHDVCMLTVNSDLNVDTDIATSAPEIYDSATVSGHPALLPNIISEGHFAANELIYLIHSFKECTKKEKRSKKTGFMCAFFGKLPVFKAYESTVVTALIMGGSSGSAVYNYRNQVSGLVFAGRSKGLSFAFTVPYEYVASFADKVKEYKRVVPAYTLGLSELMNAKVKEDDFSSSMRELKQKCSSIEPDTHTKIKEVCNKVGTNTLWLKGY